MKANNINWNIAILILLLSSMVSPYVSKLYSGYVGLIPMLFVFIFLILLGKNGNYIIKFVTKKHRLNRKLMFYLTWFIVGVGFTFFRGATDYQYYISVLVLPIYFYAGTLLSTNELYNDFVLKSILFFILLNILITGQSVGFIETARDIYEDSNFDSTAGTSGFWAIIGIFFPFFLLMIFNQRNYFFKIVYLAIVLFVIFKLIFSGFTTPIILFVLNCILISIFFVLKKNNNSKQLFKKIGLSVLTFLIVSSALNFILSTEIESLSEVKWRITNLIENPENGGYDELQSEGSRLKLMNFSFNTFSENLFFGAGGNIRSSIYERIIGGHSSLIDLLAVMGIFAGGGAFLFFMIKCLKNSYDYYQYNNSLKGIINLSVNIVFFIGGILNPYWSGPLLLCFLLITNVYFNKKFNDC